MPKTAPCYSKINYYKFFEIDLKNKQVLDIGSSIGSFKKSTKFGHSKNDLNSAANYTTIDIDPASGANIIGDAHTLPFKDNKFDLIIANNVIEHFYDPDKAVREMYRVLKKGGWIYFTVPFLYPIHEAPNDYVRYTRYGLVLLFSDFHDVKIFTRGGFFSTTAQYFFQLSHAFDEYGVGNFLRLIQYPLLWIWVQLDRFDTSNAFVRTYFGKMQKK